MNKTEKPYIDTHMWIPKHLIEKINLNLEKRPGVRRSFWILEAIEEKLKREKLL